MIKYLLILAVVILISLFSGSSNNEQLSPMTLMAATNAEETVDNKLYLKDLVTRFVGYTGDSDNRTTLEMNIARIDSSAREISFRYVLNSSGNEINGVGKIHQDMAMIEIDDRMAGKIYYQSDKRIAMEALNPENGGYWKMWEK